MEPELQDIITLAKSAGEILRAGYGQPHEIGHKGRVDLVTEVDRRSEAHILQQLRSRYPDHPIIAEESGRLDGSAAATWFVDPLDGTVNYAHAIPIFSVSIAFAQNGSLRHGVVYDPMRDECFSATAGEGAWLNGQPLRVSNTQEMVDSLLVTGFPYDLWKSPVNNLEFFGRFARQTQGVRRLGSAALDLCYVAAGRFDGYWELKLQPWDIAAGALICREAGARVTNLEGAADILQPPYSILTANPAMHTRMFAVLHETCAE
ncbi:MAG: inositol monophosphatase family protein [Anaerolineaceae bacterium]